MILTDADELRETLAIAVKERDEARAEVERLTEERDRVARELRLLDEHGNLRAAIRAAAERQREACAKEFCTGPERKRMWASLVRATPLVTESDK